MFNTFKHLLLSIYSVMVAEGLASSFGDALHARGIYHRADVTAGVAVVAASNFRVDLDVPRKRCLSTLVEEAMPPPDARLGARRGTAESSARVEGRPMPRRASGGSPHW